MRFLLLISMCWLAFGSAAHAAQVKRYASIVVDADTHEIIHARQVDGARYPASLTKVMTLYLTFDALNAGTLKINEPMTVSRHAASTPPYGLGLKTGQKITVDDAIQALTVRSANDAAVVLAERIAGSDTAFAALMTAKARELNMQNTTFMTPHGLPDPEQTTTARDMAKLASALLTNHRRYYHYFGQKNFTWKGRTRRNTNALLRTSQGVDGFKTGFTNDSGYNLIISAERDGRRIIAVVLGGASGKSRDQHMRDLIERSFKVIGTAPAPSRTPITIAKAAEPAQIINASVPQIVRLRGQDHGMVTIQRGGDANIRLARAGYDTQWSIQVGAFGSNRAAQEQLGMLSSLNTHGLTLDAARILPFRRGNTEVYRARFTALTATQAQAACTALSNLPSGCLVIAPGG